MKIFLLIALSVFTLDFGESIVSSNNLERTFSGLRWNIKPKKTRKMLLKTGADLVNPAHFFEDLDHQDTYWHLLHLYMNQRDKGKKKWRSGLHRFDLFEKRRSVIVAQFYNRKLEAIYHITHSSIRIFRSPKSAGKKLPFDFGAILERESDQETMVPIPEPRSPSANPETKPNPNATQEVDSSPEDLPLVTNPLFVTDLQHENSDSVETVSEVQTTPQTLASKARSSAYETKLEEPDTAKSNAVPSERLAAARPELVLEKTALSAPEPAPAQDSPPEIELPTYGLLILLVTISLLLSFTYRGRVKLNNRFKQQARHHQEAQTVIGRLSHELSHAREQCERYNCQISELEAQKRELERQNLDLRYQKNAHTKKGDGFIDRTKKFVRRCREVDTRKYRSCKTSLQKAFHPDHYPEVLQDEATELSKEINSLF
ncbi:hypothetical protein SCOR_33345 [Sulfidibacter corallicola]|uniref:Uncharacterized protein n=1 Tax=Sulfidibacter corallicola TaxID=2818388 RepID=A0A8A4TL44_SULCO|nr:hypothetical protein [Sulfidibacter corallicola]QTD49578.1 hypothetical protein J3U87_28660 [Sulfidibacter corallicola]